MARQNDDDARLADYQEEAARLNAAGAALRAKGLTVDTGGDQPPPALNPDGTLKDPRAALPVARRVPPGGGR